MKAIKTKLILSVQKAIDILNCFEGVCPVLTLGEISDKTGININTTRGLVNTLVANNLLVHNKDTLTYSLGLFFLGKADIIRNHFDSYIAIFKPVVDYIAEKYSCSASLQLVSQDEICSIYCAYPSNRAYYIVLSEFVNLPLHATSSGKLLLLERYKEEGDSLFEKHIFESYTSKSIRTKELLLQQLKQIDKQGYSTEIEEYAYDVGSIAVPVYGESKELLLTVSATGFVKNLSSVKNSIVNDLKSASEIWQQ